MSFAKQGSSLNWHAFCKAPKARKLGMTFAKAQRAVKGWYDFCKLKIFTLASPALARILPRRALGMEIACSAASLLWHAFCKASSACVVWHKFCMLRKPLVCFLIKLALEHRHEGDDDDDGASMLNR